MFEFVVVKVSTTGVDLISDKIIEVALLHMNSNMELLNTFHTLVYSDVKIPKMVEEMTKITNDAIISAPEINSIRDDIISFIGDKPIVGHYLDFDISFLESELGVKFKNKRMDTYKMARATLKFEEVPNFRLATLCNHFDIPDTGYTGALHNASLVAKLFASLIPVIVEKKKRIDEMNKRQDN